MLKITICLCGLCAAAGDAAYCWPVLVLGTVYWLWQAALGGLGRPGSYGNERWTALIDLTVASLFSGCNGLLLGLIGGSDGLILARAGGPRSTLARASRAPNAHHSRPGVEELERRLQPSVYNLPADWGYVGSPNGQWLVIAGKTPTSSFPLRDSAGQDVRATSAGSTPAFFVAKQFVLGDTRPGDFVVQTASLVLQRYGDLTVHRFRRFRLRGRGFFRVRTTGCRFCRERCAAWLRRWW